MSNTKISQLFDKMANVYDQWFDDNPRVVAAEIAAIRQVTLPFNHALEVGVGTGRFAEALGIKLGVEPSVAMANLARARGIEVVEGFAQALPYADVTFDTLFMITVDCYLEQLTPVLRECHRVLLPSGVLVIGHIDIDTPLGALYQAEKEKDVFYRDATFRGTNTIIDKLKQTGFEVEAIRQTVSTLENIDHEVRFGHGDGVFVALRARKC
ncbi:MAG: methyltransferase domain-containing protein [Lentisphaerae bacterium]|nr:methyltransferase domain-containing protein [Lentisphaerota bacterium]